MAIDDSHVNTSEGALLYVLRELGRRAGASAEWIAQWRVGLRGNEVSLFPVRGSESRIVFWCDRSKPARREALCAAPASLYGWMQRDVVVLFEDAPSTGTPLFERRDDATIACRADLLTSALWTLARMEEYAPAPRDEHGRFPAKASAAFRAGCLERPIVDEYAAALRQVLCELAPGWVPDARGLRVKLTHDIDLTGLPRNLRTIAGHLYRRKLPAAFARDALSVVTGARTAYLEAALRAARMSRERGFTSAFYWQVAQRTAWDSGYDVAHPVIRAVIEELAAQGCEMGLHPGYETYDSPDRLRTEVDRARGSFGAAPMGGRQHFLRWSPRTWQHWERAGLAYDSTVGFADAMGFRAGTCVPFHPWLLDEDRESTLLEIPLIVMDSTPVKYMGLSANDALHAVRRLVERCAAAGGVFTLLWHNASVIERPYAQLYPDILAMLQGGTDYDWTADAAISPLPAQMERV